MIFGRTVPPPPPPASRFRDYFEIVGVGGRRDEGGGTAGSHPDPTKKVANGGRDVARPMNPCIPPYMQCRIFTPFYHEDLR